jgi:2'-5' RNA ligase
METGLVKQAAFTTPRLADSPGMDIHSERGARRAEYLLVIYPSGELQEKLLDEQRQFSADYGLQMTVRESVRRFGPHITVAAFQAGEIMEDTLIRWVQRICNNYKCFELTLNNYSGFPPHTIYLRVQDPHPFRQLMQQLRTIDEFIRSSGCPPANLITRPFLSIAGGLTEQLYNKAMPEYSRKTFHDSFRVDELVLLKRTHSFDACKTVNIFRLQPETINPQSGITSPSAVLPPHHL